MQKCKEVYLSLDVETDGPCPGMHSMLSLGAAAIGWDTDTHKWEMSHTFYANLEPLPECSQDHRTMEEFWKKNPEAWAAVLVDRDKPLDAMCRFRSWVASVHTMWGRRPVAVGAPAVVDYSFVRYYLLKFLKTDYPFGHRCVDVRSVASTALKLPYYEAGKSAYPKRWMKDGHRHTHISLDDAIEQGWIYARMVDDL